ncbi:pyridoxal 5'-phosphate synthase glutaminase subunit PdxT [Hyperthermus butylicus]|uniref:Pyridoxal 5'-phosphate synthase subunit PdxT n=1 Tax=Hyperthermus butylicus (strain DSM 5456 / JCM 9403 / PLM1-5) TaxID=415426 RepID=PDXT_HYPBU|nr:pyridoxal 5'-phosphate synthase glutaminase subunit PdxT [Hyperthermus butylicus]A2BLL6.1 RecName: Full=Pyridoxal 5'-phosphate synthase subunit PdxT; AltName: Full=Pdx2; AltName: Full=Pyridoxal 5'-phosphate synthase glutaminase subunit [Hyperthermus butylicus DSM 5456]ABM80877.1 putative glutamine amidotransferase [Hyperthermus butylicus DSM 5456]
MVVVGVLALQGDWIEHIELLREIEGVEAVPVKTEKQLESIDALIIPGGESTTIGRLIERRGLLEPLRDRIRAGLPVLGTCAGSILLAKKVRDRVVGPVEQPLLAVMDIAVLRNAFGRQMNSFEAEVHIEGVGTVHAAFIRAPIIEETWGEARPIAKLNHPLLGEVTVAARQKAIIATVFHPEITGDSKLHKLLVAAAKGRAF